MLGIFAKKPPGSDEITLWQESPHYKPELELDKFKIDGKEYQRLNKIQTQVIAKKRREKRSLAWRLGEKLLRVVDGRAVYYCYLCEREKRPQELYVINGNTPALDHLREVHKLDKDGNKIQPVPPPDQLKITTRIHTAVSTYNYEEFKRLLVRWIVYCSIAFQMLENDYFRQLLCFVNEGLGALLPKAASTVRCWVMEAYEKHKDLLRQELHDVLSNIHLSFDLWTSPNCYAMISIYGHFINQQGERRTQLLAFRRLYGNHSGENQADIILEVINEYDIGHQIGFFVCDNAKSNDIAVAEVLKTLFPKMKAKHVKGRRLRCFGHITNLCARAILLGKGAGKAITEMERKVAKGGLEAVDGFWRARGVVGRLHNIVRYIRWTPQRREAFAGCKKGGKLAEFDDLMVSGCPLSTK